MESTQKNQRWLIVTIHGIRTIGAWQERLDQLITRQKPSAISVDILRYKYGYFLAFSLAVPLFRLMAARRFRAHLLGTLELNHYSRVNIVAHSFGTYLACKALAGIRRKDFPPIHTILLAGCVLPAWFPWERLRGMGVSKMVNDCGTRDLPLLLCQLVPWLGMAGREGFRGLVDDSFCNRFFSYGHSEYFRESVPGTQTFLEKYWVPLLIADDPPELIDQRKRGVDEAITTLFQYLKPAISLTWGAAAAALVYGSLSVYHLNQSHRSVARVESARQLQAERRYPLAVAMAATALAIQPSADAENLILALAPMIPGASVRFVPSSALDPGVTLINPLSPDGNTLGIAGTAEGSFVTEIDAFDLAKREIQPAKKCPVPDHDSVDDFRFSAGGQRVSYIVSEGKSRVLEVLDLQHCEPLQQGQPYGSVLSPNGTYLVQPSKAGAHSAHVTTVDSGVVRDLEIDSQLLDETSDHTLYGFSCDGESLVAANSHGAIEVLDLNSKKPKQTVQVPLPNVSQAALVGVSASNDGNLVARRWQTVNNGQVASAMFLDVVDVIGRSSFWSTGFSLQSSSDTGELVPPCGLNKDGLLTFDPHAAWLWTWGTGNPTREFVLPDRTPIRNAEWGSSDSTVRIVDYDFVVTSFDIGRGTDLITRSTPISISEIETDTFAEFDADPISGRIAVGSTQKPAPPALIEPQKSGAQRLSVPWQSGQTEELRIATGGTAVAVWYIPSGARVTRSDASLCVFYVGQDTCALEEHASRALEGVSGRFSHTGGYFAYLAGRRDIAVSRLPSSTANDPSASALSSQPDQAYLSESTCGFWRGGTTSTKSFRGGVVRHVPPGHTLRGFLVEGKTPSLITLEFDESNATHVYQVNLAMGCTIELTSAPGAFFSSTLETSLNDHYLAILLGGATTSHVEVLRLAFPWHMVKFLHRRLPVSTEATTVAVTDDGSAIAIGVSSDAARTSSAQFSSVDFWDVESKTKYLSVSSFGLRMAFSPDDTFHALERNSGPPALSTLSLGWKPKYVLTAACRAAIPAIDSQQWSVWIGAAAREIPFKDFTMMCSHSGISRIQRFLNAISPIK